MTMLELKQIFSQLPEIIKHDFEKETFQTCWYGSAGLDTKIFDYFSNNNTPESLLTQILLDNNPVRVYFFTDKDYLLGRDNEIEYHNKHYNFQNGISSPFQYEGLIRIGECITSLMFAKRYRAKLVRFGINSLSIYCFYISINDELFEKMLIQKKFKIDIACHAGGWAGSGPTLLNDLGAKFFLGHYNGFIEQDNNVQLINNNVNWGLCGQIGNISCPFYRIIRQ
jgi:hypothetical protein